MSWNVIKITVLERGTRLGGPQGILRGMLLGHFFALSVQKQIFPDLHMIRVKPIAVFNKMVSSKRGSLEEGSGDAFLPYPSKTNFSGPQYNPLGAAYGFEQNDFILKGVLWGRLLGCIFARSLQRQIFPDPIWSTLSRLQLSTKWSHPKWSHRSLAFGFVAPHVLLLLVYRILGSKTKNTVYSSFLSLTVEKTISYYYLLSLLVPIISYYSFLGGRLY